MTKIVDIQCIASFQSSMSGGRGNTENMISSVEDGTAINK